MILFEPYIIAESEMSSGAAIAYDATYFGSDWQGEWSAGSYDEGDVVWEDLKLYESATAANTDQPSVGAVADTPTWIELGYVNPWRMFDSYVGTDELAITEKASPLEVEITTDQVSHVGLFNVNADTLLIEILDSEDDTQWYKTYSLIDDALAIGDWYDYFYIPYPPIGRDLIVELGWVTSSSSSEKIKITLTSGGTVSCSNCFVGFGIEPGNTQWEPDIKAYSTGSTNTDTFGRTSFVKGSTYKVINAIVRPPTGSENYVLRQITDMQDIPIVFDLNNDGTDYDLLRIYGAITSVSQVLTGPNNTTIDIEITGIVKKEDI